MLLLRDEEHVERWCLEQGLPRGEAVPLEQAWRLAVAWYSDRLDLAWRRNTPEETEATFREVGLTSAFWCPAS
ncbi:MAG: hypothetical protein H0T39_11325 [Actinobacteria bacterium]|nr:hypothetical protein [Actinomycetota bacterium]